MATKKFPYAVVYNGKFYPANTPIVDETEVKETSTPTEKKAVNKNDKRTSRKA